MSQVQIGHLISRTKVRTLKAFYEEKSFILGLKSHFNTGNVQITDSLFTLSLYQETDPNTMNETKIMWSPAVHPKQGPKATIDMIVTGGLASSSYPATASSTSS